MEDIWNSIQNGFEAYGPKAIAAALILIGFIVAAYIAKWLIGAAIDKTGLAKKANATTVSGGKSLGASLSSAAFWVIVLIGLVQALTKLEMNTIVDPLNNMLSQILAYLPKIIGAVIIFGVFMIVAHVVRQASKAVFVFADGLPEQLGFASGPTNISGITATVLSAMVMILGGSVAINTLGIETLSGPVNGILNDIGDAIPNIAIAALLLTVFVFIGRFVSNLISKTLPGFGIDTAVAELGVLKGADSGLTASSVIAKGSMFFIVLLGLIQALKALKFEALTDAMNVILSMGAQIAFGAVIIFAGVFLARLITGAMASAGSGATDVAANVVKWVIIILSVILGISRMGLDPTGGTFILHVAEYLIIGASAGLALAFGLGGKDWAAKQLERWRD